MKILVVYFSPTSNTKKIAAGIIQAFTENGAQVDEKDITSLSDRSAPLDLSQYDAVSFGFPIYVSRAPAIIREWLRTLDGGRKRSSTFFTYGGMTNHPAHRSTRAILEGQNFEVVSSAEFLGMHTFNRVGWEAMEGRPDQSDLDTAKEYAVKTMKRFSGEDEDRPADFPKGRADDNALDQMEVGWKATIPQFPSRMGEDCSMCMDCENLCPSGAIDAEKGEADKDKCILCLRCVDICPEEVLQFCDLSKMFDAMLGRQGKTKEEIAGKKSKLFF
jgi:ferredoxin